MSEGEEVIEGNVSNGEDVSEGEDVSDAVGVRDTGTQQQRCPHTLAGRV